jgi:glycosyltransferase involved in cell wall biosynthesis
MAFDLVSVVIPTFNYRAYVAQAVESALAQTYPHVEVIVVDDGSTDDTREVLAPYVERVSYMYQENQGLSAARNTGIRAARGKWVALLDSDDLWHPRKLEMQMAYLTRHPEVGLVATDNLRSLEDGWPASLGAAGEGVPVTLQQLAVRARFGPSSVVIRKDCFDRVGLFDPALRSCEDRDMWIRIASHFPIVKLQGPLWWYRSHEGSMTRSMQRMEENEFRMLQKSVGRIALPEFRGRVKEMAFGYAYFESAIRYAEVGQNWRGLGKLARSLLAWPFPFRAGDTRRPLERGRLLLVLLLRACGLKAGPKRAEHVAPANQQVEGSTNGPSTDGSSVHPAKNGEAPTTSDRLGRFPPRVQISSPVLLSGS